MTLQLLLFAAFALLGVQLQRRPDGADVLRARLWTLNYVLLIPLAATYAILSVELDRSVVEVVGVGVVAWWLTVVLAGAWARVATRDRSMRGATWLVGAFPNTGFVGFPLANLAYGPDGLRLAVIYDQVSLVVPAIVVGVLIARRYADPDAADASDDRSALRDALLSPPLLTVLALLALRLTIVPEPLELDWLGAGVGLVVGPVGFLLLGLSLPLDGFVHDRRELVATTGAVLVRVAAAPLVVLAVAALFGVDVPPALLLIAAMPTAFHALIVARVNGLDVGVLRLGIVLSSAIVIVATLVVAT